MRPLSIILMIAFLLQASSQRACVIDKIVTGSNCHDVGVIEEHSSKSGFTDTVPADCPDHSDACVCNMEKHSSGDYTHVAPVFHVFQHIPPILLPNRTPMLAPVPPDLADRLIIPLPVNLPLLI
jgi:hypothetical protein